jgi:hypothetical protein
LNAIPPSRIPSVDKITEDSVTPPEGDNVEAIWNGIDFTSFLVLTSLTFLEETHVWRITLFPSPIPTSRREIVLLESWLNKKLDEILAAKFTPIGNSWLFSECLSFFFFFAEVVQHQQKVFSICFHEITRQVYATCAERGELMRRIWERYTQLFQHVLKVRELETQQHKQSCLFFFLLLSFLRIDFYFLRVTTTATYVSTTLQSKRLCL